MVETATSNCSDSNTADVTAAIQSGGTPPFIFQWSNGQVDTHAVQSTLISVEVGVPYSLTITDASGCVQSAGPIVPQCEPLSIATLAVGERNSRAGKRVCLPVTAEALQDLDSLQFALQWNPALLYLEGVQPGLLQHGFDLSQSEEGIFRLAWGSGGSPLSIDGEELLFDLCFTVIASPGQAVPIRFLQPPLAYDIGQEPLFLQTVDGAVFLDSVMGEDALQLNVDSGTVEAGEAICLDISTRNFTEVLGMQFSLRWNPDTLRLDSIVLDGELPMTLNNFNLQGSAEGRLSVQWLDNSLAGVSLPGEARLFTACFTAGPETGQSLLFFSSVPTLIEFTDGDLLLPVEVGNGLVEVLPEPVRPGDTDRSRQVNHYDLLNIGLGYGATGPERPNAALTWEKQPAPGWEHATPASGVDFKHLDTDGNGRIEAADTLAIVLNYGLHANPFSPEAPPLRTANTLMYVRPDTISPGEPVVFDIMLGEEAMPAEEVYGIAFTVVYDTAAVYPGSAVVMLRQSWMGILDEGLLLLQHDHPERGRLDVAITRTDGIDVSGYGPLAQMYITIQDVIFRRLPDHELLFDIEKIRLINSREELAAVTGQQSASVVLGAVNGVGESSREPHIRVFPNPTPDIAYFDTPAECAELFSLDGRQLLEKDHVGQLSLGHLPTGPYLLRLWRDGQASVHLLCRH